MGETSRFSVAELAERREIIAQIAAISAFEGLYPTEEYESFRERIVLGEISFEDAIEMVNSGRLDHV